MCASSIQSCREKTERCLSRKNCFVLRLDFLENVGLNCPTQIRHTLEPKRRCAATIYIAMMIGAGPLMVIDPKKFGAPNSNPS